MSKKVIVCGSRWHADREKVWEVLDAYYARIGPEMELILGGANGADESARSWAVDRKVDHRVLYAKWAIDGKASGFIRNRRMLAKKPKLVLAFFWGKTHPHRGTKDMVKISRDANVKVKEFH